MIDVNAARYTLLLRWRQNRFVELDEPEDTEEYSYIAVKPKPENYIDDFDFLFWEPSLIALEKAVLKDDGGKFYKVEVFYDGDVLVMASSCGKYPQPPKLESTVVYDELVKCVFKVGGGMIPCGERLGVFASTQENIARCPQGWIFVDMATATLAVLQEAVTTAKEGRGNWPEKARKDSQSHQYDHAKELQKRIASLEVQRASENDVLNSEFRENNSSNFQVTRIDEDLRPAIRRLVDGIKCNDST